MDDTISRLAVIQIIEQTRARIGHNLERSVGRAMIEILDEVGEDVGKLPSALGTNLASLGTDCISRQQAIDALNELRESTYEDNYGVFDSDDAINVIASLPPKDPKRGKWIKTARWGRVYYCDQCRNYLDFDGVNAGRGSTNFCPNCGCRMDGGE